MRKGSCCMFTSGVIGAVLLIMGTGLFVSGLFQTLIHNKLKGVRAVFAEDWEFRPKHNVSFVHNGTKVAAYTKKIFVFEPEKSVGDPNVDLVTTVNIPAVAAMNRIKSAGFWASSAFSMYMGSIGTTMFMTHTVQELLWGFKDPLLTRLKTIKPETDEYFGLMLHVNSNLECFQITFSLVEHEQRTLGLLCWRGQLSLSFSSDSSPRFLRERRLQERSIHMRFEKEVELKGIPAYRFTPPRDTLASGKNNPENEGFCVTPKKCLDDGVLDVSVCRKGAPVVVSFPHFHLGDEKYAQAIDGISPVHEHHQTFLDLNPTMGVPVRAMKRAQFNIHLERVSGFPLTRNLNNTIFPILFLNESVVIDDASAARIQKLLLIVTLVSHFPLILVAMGVILVLVSIILAIRFYQNKVIANTQNILETA
uniref:Lysosome membrane protein 2-like n=1 Tax=Cyprinus carpio TaxID=7962 RepID=A0A8C2JHR1_CYPCA